MLHIPSESNLSKDVMMSKIMLWKKDHWSELFHVQIRMLPTAFVFEKLPVVEKRAFLCHEEDMVGESLLYPISEMRSFSCAPFLTMGAQVVHFSSKFFTQITHATRRGRQSMEEKIK